MTRLALFAVIMSLASALIYASVSAAADKAPSSTTAASTTTTTVTTVQTGPVVIEKKAFMLDMQLSVDGKKVSSPRMTVFEGEQGSITQKGAQGETFIDVIATEQISNGKPGVMMKFTVGTIEASGQRRVISKPQILAQVNQRAEITVSSTTAKPESVSLSVLATRASKF